LSCAAKQRVVLGLLAVLAVWPPIHRALVARHWMSPWRLFGWAMYCTPKLPRRAELYVVRDGQRVRLDVSDSQQREVREAMDAFLGRRDIWGTLVRPDQLAAIALASQPDSEAVEIEVEHLFLHPGTARIAAQRFAYAYPRRADPR